MLKVGDLVTRNSYHNDIVFKIIDIVDNIYYLKGTSVRLCADSYLEDLQPYNSKEEEFNPMLNSFEGMDRDEFFYLPGKILHIEPISYKNKKVVQILIK